MLTQIIKKIAKLKFLRKRKILLVYLPDVLAATPRYKSRGYKCVVCACVYAYRYLPTYSCMWRRSIPKLVKKIDSVIIIHFAI